MRTPRLLAWLVILLAAGAVAFAGLWWQERAVVAAYRDEAVCWRVVRAGGAAWEDVTVLVTSHPKAAVVGTVAVEAERQRLHRQLSAELGAERMGRVAFNVRVEGEPVSERDPPGVGR